MWVSNLHQEHVLSLVWIIIFMDTIDKCSQTGKVNKSSECKFSLLEFADDMAPPNLLEGYP